MKPENVLFFDSRADFRAWLERTIETSDYQWVGFYKKAAGRAGLTYSDAVLEALCFGWIDGQGAGIDVESRAIRFSKRRARSIWSTVNVKHMERLIAEGRVAPAGLGAYEARTPETDRRVQPRQRPCRVHARIGSAFSRERPFVEVLEQHAAGLSSADDVVGVSAKREETRRDDSMRSSRSMPAASGSIRCDCQAGVDQ